MSVPSSSFVTRCVSAVPGIMQICFLSTVRSWEQKQGGRSSGGFSTNVVLLAGSELSRAYAQTVKHALLFQMILHSIYISKVNHPVIRMP